MRFVCYGFAGVGFEILFTGAKRLIFERDLSMRGKSYIWMFPIYGLAAFLFEPAHDLLRPWPWPLRGLLYTIGLFAVESTRTSPSGSRSSGGG